MTILHFFSFHRITSSYRCRLEVVLRKDLRNSQMESKMTCRGDETDHVLRCLVVADVFSPRRYIPPPEFWEQNRLFMQIQFPASLLFPSCVPLLFTLQNFFSPTPHWIFALECRIGIWICCNALSKDTESWCRPSLDSYPWLWMKKLWRWWDVN